MNRTLSTQVTLLSLAAYYERIATMFADLSVQVSGVPAGRWYAEAADTLRRVDALIKGERTIADEPTHIEVLKRRVYLLVARHEDNARRASDLAWDAAAADLLAQASGELTMLSVATSVDLGFVIDREPLLQAT